MKHDISKIFESCLDDILAGRKSLDKCLETHADIRDSLDPMLRTAIRIANLDSIEPSKERSAASRERILAEVERRSWESGIERKPDADVRAAIDFDIDRTRRRFAYRLGIVTLIFVLVSGATLANASQSSLPDSSLYPLKRSIEGIRVLIAVEDKAKQQVYLDLAAERIQELENLPNNSTLYSELAKEAEDDLEMAKEYSVSNSTDDDQQIRNLRIRNRDAIRKVLEQAPNSERSKLKSVLRWAESVKHEDGDDGITTLRKPTKKEQEDEQKSSEQKEGTSEGVRSTGKRDDKDSVSDNSTTGSSNRKKTTTTTEKLENISSDNKPFYDNDAKENPQSKSTTPGDEPDRQVKSVK